MIDKEYMRLIMSRWEELSVWAVIILLFIMVAAIAFLLVLDVVSAACTWLLALVVWLLYRYCLWREQEIRDILNRW